MYAYFNVVISVNDHTGPDVLLTFSKPSWGVTGCQPGLFIVHSVGIDGHAVQHRTISMAIFKFTWITKGLQRNLREC